MDDSFDVLRYALLPMAAIVLGGLLASWRTPGPELQSTIQHFTAGVVFAAVAAEVLPEAMAENRPLALGAGFAIGVVAMLALRAVTERGSSAGGPTGLVAAVGINVLVDGLLIGVAFAAGSTTGIVITIALTIELLFVGLAVALATRKAGGARHAVIGTNTALALVLGLGATIGTLLLADLSGGPFVAVLAFATAALLYLVTEELLVEAHNLGDTSLGTTMFFAGFLTMLVLESFA